MQYKICTILLVTLLCGYTQAYAIAPAVQQHITNTLDTMIKNHGIFSIPVIVSGFDDIYQKYSSTEKLIPYLDIMSGHIAQRMEQFRQEYTYTDIPVEESVLRLHHHKNCHIYKKNGPAGHFGAYADVYITQITGTDAVCGNSEEISTKVTLYTEKSMNAYLDNVLQLTEEQVGDYFLYISTQQRAEREVDEFHILQAAFLTKNLYKT